MAQDNSSKLSFTIEESVWLNKGQEIDEVISMSLNPEISIEERNDHVQIKGGLRLQGEYRLAESSVDELIDSDDLTFRSIDEVVQNKDGIGKVEHFFPIDVTIPLNRISNLQDIFVQVESFDYDLPDKSCIQLTADVVISGMSHEPQETKENTERIPILTNEALEPFEFDAKVKIPDIPPINTIPIAQEIERKEDSSNNETNVHQEITGESEVEKDREDEQLVQNNAEQDTASNEEEPELVRSEQQSATEETDEREINQSETEEQDEDERSQLQEETKITIAHHEKMADTTEGEQLDATNEEKSVSKPRKNENALYLTKMLSNGEEKFSKLRMCIIQPNESLDMIAERYNISLSQLIRMNRLESERLEEGQILYIPVGKNG